MRLIKIYHLQENHVTEEVSDLLKKTFKADLLISMRANNQLENIQYPVIEIDDFEEIEATDPPLRDTNTYIENGMPKFPGDRITKHQEG